MAKLNLMLCADPLVMKSLSVCLFEAAVFMNLVRVLVTLVVCFQPSFKGLYSLTLSLPSIRHPDLSSSHQITRTMSTMVNSLVLPPVPGG